MNKSVMILYIWSSSQFTNSIVLTVISLIGDNTSIGKIFRYQSVGTVEQRIPCVNHETPCSMYTLFISLERAYV